ERDPPARGEPMTAPGTDVTSEAGSGARRLGMTSPNAPLSALPRADRGTRGAVIPWCPRGGTAPTATALGAVAAVLVATAVAPDRVPLGVVLLGALIGTGNGLLAVGLVLTYRSHRVVNFAL